jgi:hypothetical protein
MKFIWPIIFAVFIFFKFGFSGIFSWLILLLAGFGLVALVGEGAKKLLEGGSDQDE